VYVRTVLLIGEIAGARNFYELGVIPEEHDGSVGLSLHYVTRQLVLEAGNQEGRDTTDRRQPVLEDIIQYLNRGF